MRSAVFAMTTALALSACVADEGPAESYPFVGRWDCGVAVLTFTNTTYNNGTTTYPIRLVSRDGRNYTLRFGEGQIIGLGAVTETGLTWISGSTGSQHNCRRLG